MNTLDMDDFKAALAKARDEARDAMETAFACAMAFEALLTTAGSILDNASGTDNHGMGPYTPKTYNPDSPPDLTGSALLEAKVDGKPIEEKSWNGALRAITKKAAMVVTSPEERSRIFKFRWESGNLHGKQGLVYIPDVDISIQGRETDVCWREMYNIAYYLKVPIEVVFRLPQKEGSASPGVIGRLAFDGKPFVVPELDLESI